MPLPAIIYIIGLALSAFGAVQAGSAQRAQRRYQQKVAASNQKVSLQEAEYAKQMGAKKEGEHRMKTRRLAAKQRAAQASSGFLVDTGSFGDILDDTALLGDADALAIRHEGEIEAWKATNRAAQFGSQAGLFGLGTSDYASEIAGAGTLLSGLGELDYGTSKKKE